MSLIWIMIIIWLLIISSIPLIFVFKKKWDVPSTFTFTLFFIIIYVMVVLSSPDSFGQASIEWEGVFPRSLVGIKVLA